MVGDIIVPHDIVYSALMDYCGRRYSELLREINGAQTRLAQFGIEDKASKVYTHQLAELTIRVEQFRRLHAALSGSMGRIVIDYGPEEIKVVELGQGEPSNNMYLLKDGQP